MTQPAWMNDPIGYMLSPTDRKTFFDQHHEKTALRIQRDDPGRFLELLSLQRIDELIASIDFEAGALDMTRADPPIHREDFTFASGMVDRGAVARHFQQGATIILPQLHQFDRTLASFCRSLSNELSCHVQTNIYLTPPDAQGFRTHYDDHDVFVLQISGSKTWRLYDTPVQNPFRGEGYQSGAHPIGEPEEEFVLKAGEVVYVPRGLMHDALTHGDEPSLHITVGLIVKTWADLMLEAVSEVALRDERFRRALPPGFARADFDRSGAEGEFKSMLAALAESADFESAMDLFTDNYIRSRTPDSAGAIAGLDRPNDPGQSFRLRPLIPWRLAEDGEELVIITAGGEIRMPGATEPAVHTLLDGGTIKAGSFDALPEDEQMEQIRRLFAYGLIEPA
jgi:mannose-6-phosphate isomerase-like protein (cupin superfamily)